MPNWAKNLLTVATALFVLFAIFSLLDPGDSPTPVSLTDLRGFVNARQVEEVVVRGHKLEGTLRNGTRIEAVGELDDELAEALGEQGVPVHEEAQTQGNGWTFQDYLFAWGPLLVLGAFIFWALRRNGANVLSLRRGRHQLVKQDTGVRFADVGGCEDAKRQLGDVVDFLANPKRWADAGVRAPRGILLEGPPGCGKTLLARALAGETKAHFVTVNGSEFVEIFIGVGPARVRDLFETAAKQAPVVVFIDELDAIGRRRNTSFGMSSGELEATLNQLLVSLDGFRPTDRVVVLAATNRADILDPALIRAGRFDRRIRVPLLSREDRQRVLEIHTRGKPLASEVSLAALAERTDGMTGAELESLCNEAAMLALRRTREIGDSALSVRSEDFARAVAQRCEGHGPLTPVDTTLVESAVKLSEPVGAARVRLHLQDGTALEGELVWAGSEFLKLRRSNGDTVIPKRQLRSLESLDAEPTRLRLSAP